MSVPPVIQRADSTNQLSPDLQLITEIATGLNEEQKIISSKFFYDSVGSDLFDQICDLPEYYPYLTEMNMLPGIAADLSQIILQPVELVEFGAGSLTKIRILLESIKMITSVVPIDIAQTHLQNAADKLAADYPNVNVAPIFADFTQPVSLKHNANNQEALPKLGFFPGSTIGNFNRKFALQFLQRLRQTLGDDGMLLIGVDTKKSAQILHQAYNDKAGITAKFNLNILRHVNHIAASDFELDAFEHYAFYNPHFSRIEMHLVSKKEQRVNINGQPITLQQGETIHTENSYKYRPDEFIHLARMAGWRLEQQWLANQDMFSVFLLHADR